MNTINSESNAMPDSARDSQIHDAAKASSLTAPGTLTATRPFYWSLRRELWENRSIYIAPLAVAALILVSFMISTFRLPSKMRAAEALDPMHLHQLIQQPYEMASLFLMGAMLIVGVFYTLDALYGERRDRSILFWKSLPVSDLTTVLSKAIIPVLILPLLTFAITIATQWIILLISTAVLLGSGMSAATLWTHLPMAQMSLQLLFHLLAVHGLYFAPIYGWLMLISGWATARPISLGRSTTVRDCDRREDCLQHIAFRRLAGFPVEWR